MPGLQSIVSAWTKINHHHVEYAREGQQRGGLQHPQQQQGHQGGGGVPVQPRATTVSANTPQPSLPPSSSLSSYSFSKTKDGITDSLTATPTPPPPIGPHASSVAVFAPPSQRYPLYHHGGAQPQPLPQPLLHRIESPQPRDASVLATRSGSSVATSLSSSSRAHLQSRRSQHHQPRQHHHHEGSHPHGRLDAHPPPPRAGADAILGRRNKPSGWMPPHPLSGEPPGPVSYRSPSPNPNPAEEGAATLEKTRSTSRSTHSLSSDHSNRASSTNSGAASTAAGGGGKSPTFLGLGGPVRNKLRKSHSPADLARDMALDRTHMDPRAQPGWTLDTSSSTIARDNATASSSASGPQMSHTQQVVRMLQQQSSGESHRQQLLQPQQPQPPQSLLSQARPQRMPSFLSTPETDMNADGVRRSNSSINSADDGSRQQHRPHSPGNMGKCLDNNQHLIPPQPSSGLDDSMIRNAPLGEPLMPDSFPSHPLTRNRRESSAGSSGTAVTHNRSLANQDWDQAANSYNVAPASTSEMQPQPLTMVNAKSNNSYMATLPSDQPHFKTKKASHCDRCAQMEMALLSLQADLEYMRTSELKQEFECRDCSNKNSHHQRMDSSLSVTSNGSRGSRASSLLRQQNGDNCNGSVGTKSARTKGTNRSGVSRTRTYLREASRRLSDLSTRHKRQVKQATHERAYWQNDMHLKLEKFAMMAKSLNEEAALRLNELKETRVQLENMTSERNALAGRMATLSARVELYEHEGVEQSRLREEWSKEKSGLLDFVERAIEERDATIDDLSSRLDLAVETIENERRQQHARRQIIFPSSSRPSPPPQSRSERKDVVDGSNSNTLPSPHVGPKTDLCSKVDDLEHIQKTKEMARKAQMALQAAMVESAARKKEMQLCLNALERELAETRAAVRDSNHDQEFTSH